MNFLLQVFSFYFNKANIIESNIFDMLFTNQLTSNDSNFKMNLMKGQTLKDST